MWQILGWILVFAGLVILNETVCGSDLLLRRSQDGLMLEDLPYRIILHVRDALDDLVGNGDVRLGRELAFRESLEVLDDLLQCFRSETLHISPAHDGLQEGIDMRGKFVGAFLILLELVQDGVDIIRKPLDRLVQSLHLPGELLVDIVDGPGHIGDLAVDRLAHGLEFLAETFSVLIQAAAKIIAESMLVGGNSGHALFEFPLCPVNRCDGGIGGSFRACSFETAERILKLDTEALDESAKELRPLVLFKATTVIGLDGVAIKDVPNGWKVTKVANGFRMAAEKGMLLLLR